MKWREVECAHKGIQVVAVVAHSTCRVDRQQLAIAITAHIRRINFVASYRGQRQHKVLVEEGRRGVPVNQYNWNAPSASLKIGHRQTLRLHGTLRNAWEELRCTRAHNYSPALNSTSRL